MPSLFQTSDGYVTVERSCGRERVVIKSSPSNGKARFESNFIYVTASVGAKPHLFVKSYERRLHHDGEQFVVRNGGHSAGFDVEGKLTIF